MRSLLATLLLALALFAGAGSIWQHTAGIDDALGATPVLGVGAPLVASVTVDGVRTAVQTTRGALTTRRGGPLDPAQLEADRAALRALFVERGHWAAAVAPASVSYGAHGAHVRFHVDAGGRYRVGAATVVGAPAALAADLAAALTVRPGDRLTPSAVTANVALLEELLARAGARPGKVEAAVTADATGLTLDVAFRVVRGAR